MGLFSPWFLAGLLALGLPLWLHLLRQFKRTPQPFSSLMFFERQIQSSSKHRRLRYLTLLFLRLLLLALLALLFANPFINLASSAVAPRKLTVLVIDRSFSMRFQRLIDEAKRQATQFAAQLPGTEKAQVMALDSHLIAITQSGADKAALAQAIQSIGPDDELSSYGELVRALRVLEQTSGLSLNVHLFTDAQQTSMPAAFSDLTLGQRTSLTMHQVGSNPAPNWTVQGVSVPSRIYDAQTIRLTAGIAGWQTKQASRKVSVFLDGRQLASKDVTVPPAGRVEVEFNDLVIPFGAHRGQIDISPHDDLPDDDKFFFSVERADPRKVLFLTTPGRSAEGFFYKSALEASSQTGLRVQIESITETTRLDLSQYVLVVVNNPGEVDKSTLTSLSDYVSKGGSAFIAIGPATVREGTAPLSGNHISSNSTIQGGKATNSEIVSALAFDQVQFLTTPTIRLQTGDQLLASFSNGSPLLLEERKGEGKLFVFASTLDNSTSDFPVHGGFVPFVASTGAYLAGEANHASSVIVGGAIELRRSKDQSASADVLNPYGKHAFPLSDATSIMSFMPNQEGFYDVHPADGTRRLVAVDTDRRESNLERIPSETLILWRNTSNGGNVAPGSVLANTTVQFSLWRYLLMFLLIAALVESIFATRYLREERQAS